MQALIFVTSNEGKAIEAERILTIPLKLINLTLEEVQSLDPEHVVIKKAEDAYRKIGKPLIVDDVSVKVHAWGNFPGPFIKYLLQNNNKLFRRFLEHEPNRMATVTETIGYHDGKRVHIFTGVVKGVFLQTPRGKNGFGFDSLFIPEGNEKTFAQMRPEEKNMISHRRRALDAFKAYLLGKPLS